MAIASVAPWAGTCFHRGMPGVNERVGSRADVFHPHSWLIESRPKTEAVRTSVPIARQIFRRDSSDWNEQRLRRKYGTPSAYHWWSKSLGRKQLECVGTVFKGGETFGRGSDARQTSQPGGFCGPNSGGIAVGHNDEPTSGAANLLNLASCRDSAAANQTGVPKRDGQQTDAVQRARRIQWHFDDRKARRRQGTRNWSGLFRGDAA